MTDYDEEFDTQFDVEQNPCGAWQAIQELTAERDRYKARADHALALVAAEREACASIAEECFAPGSEEEVAGEVIAASIRARTDDDAQAALERVKQEARNEALREAVEVIQVARGRQGATAYSQADDACDFGFEYAADEVKSLITEDQSDE